MKKKILLIGSKPFNNLNISELINSFSENVRFNWSIPSKNNGNLMHELALCNHIHKYAIIDNLSLEDILKIYSSSIDEDYLSVNYAKWKSLLPKYNSVYLQENSQTAYNAVLTSLGCPFQLDGVPRTGLAVALSKLINNYRVYLYGFSIYQELRFSSYGRSDDNGDEGVHDSRSEIKIIQWLHSNNFIDASLCLLNDTQLPNISFNLNGHMKPTTFIVELLGRIYPNIEKNTSNLG